VPPESPRPYVGRFAPSPTGPLHFGSLLAAVASYLEARTRNGRWLVRIEDIDPPREQAGAAERIVRTLELYGFEWYGAVLRQSVNTPAHNDALEALLAAGHAYRCGCSRSDLADADQGPLGPIYPGTCRNGCDAEQTSIRVRTHDRPIEFVDRLQGRVRQRLESESGDFVILRKDGLVAYHLAVVVDDALQGVTDIVRGLDLLDSTPRHIHLQQLLGLPTPGYAHIPVVQHPDGSKLSKNTGAEAIPGDAVAATLHKALSALQQAPPDDLGHSAVDEVWRWAHDNWRIDRLAGLRAIDVRHYC
jgi:glutamyl-Q tRNA(Asp) synthetase